MIPVLHTARPHTQAALWFLTCIPSFCIKWELRMWAATSSHRTGENLRLQSIRDRVCLVSCDSVTVGCQKKKSFFRPLESLPNLSNSSKPANIKAAWVFSNVRSQKTATLTPSTECHTWGFTKLAKALSKASSMRTWCRIKLQNISRTVQSFLLHMARSIALPQSPLTFLENWLKSECSAFTDVPCTPQ